MNKSIPTRVFAVTGFLACCVTVSGTILCDVYPSMNHTGTMVTIMGCISVGFSWFCVLFKVLGEMQ